MNYVSKLKETYKLTSKETKNLLNTIQLGFRFKKLNSEDVEYVEREIKNIRGLEYNSKLREWFITNIYRAVSKSEKVVKTQKFNQSIDKFLRQYKSSRLKL